MGDPSRYPDIRMARFMYAMQWLPRNLRADYGREWYRHSRLHGNGGGYQLSGRMRTTIVSAHTCILRYPVSVILSLCEYPHTGPSITS
eukprot:scaffold5611_cov132-Isochrysis_galbana.AAC.18